MKCIPILKKCLPLFLLIVSLPTAAQQKDSSNIINFYSLETDMTIPNAPEAIAEGEKLFALECAECHALCRQGIGPALASVTERRPLMWLITFIKNPRNMINQGDPYANHLFENYGNKLMPEFDYLSEQEILNILAYIRDKSESEFDPPSGPPVDEERVLPDYGEEYATAYYRNDSAIMFPMDEERILNGKRLFQLHCDACHDFCKSEEGPALSSVTDRRPLPWLLSFIKNPQQMMDEGDSYAKYLHSHYDLVMPSFSFLKEDEIIDILAYIKDETAAPVEVAGSVSNKNLENPENVQTPYADQGRDFQEAKPPGRHWTAIVSYVFVVALTIAVLVFVLMRFWKRL